jgi:hypothetical protein
VKFKERDELVAGLRELADFLDGPGIAMPEPSITISVWVSDYEAGSYRKLTDIERRRNLKSLVRLLKPVEKKHEGGTLRVVRAFGPRLKLTVTVSREIACKRVPTGNTIKHAAYVSPAYQEEEFEWVCTDPLLKESA